jgi:hypothetical protein
MRFFQSVERLIVNHIAFVREHKSKHIGIVLGSFFSTIAFEMLLLWLTLNRSEFTANMIVIISMIVAVIIYSSLIIVSYKLRIRSLSSIRGIKKAPGQVLLSFVDFLFSPKTVKHTFKPLIADWRYEYFEALKQGRSWKARWISVRYRFSFINAMTLSKVFSLLKQIKSVSK